MVFLLIKDLIDPEKGIGQIFKTLWYIIFVTFTVELIGAYSIFFSIGGNSWNDVGFAVFHSISAFCNAGFSTVSGGLFNEALQANYKIIEGLNEQRLTNAINYIDTLFK